jgi:NADH-quinone oxidoreductase subunit K
MINVPLETGLAVAAILFVIGLAGVLTRRNIVFMLMSVEIMLNSAGLAFITGSAYWKDTDGQIMVIFILTTAAAEVAIGLALIIQMYRHFKTLDADAASNLRG